MTKIIKYQQNYDGKFTVIVEGVEIDDRTMQLIDNNISVLAELKIIDPQRITGKQRRKIFALVNDIEAHTGQPRDYMRQMFQDYVKFINGYDERISLADCSRKIAKEIIEVIIKWVFLNDIPLNYKTSDMLKENKAFLYHATVKRQCVICGAPNSDLAHYETVGRGMNRKTIDHYDKHVLALCRKHHNEQHNIGVKSFDDKYCLKNSWINVDEKLNKMLRGEKI
ncbi:putative HNHc nuclease [Staphylococcus xylosus]